MIYLACPYESKSELITDERVATAGDIATRLIKHGYAVFSPINYSNGVNTSVDNMFTCIEWYKHGIQVLAHCDRLIVLKMPGWKESIGVQMEIAVARLLNIKIRYFDLPVCETTLQFAATG